jgi:SAM-dependent methyltransferase
LASTSTDSSFSITSAEFMWADSHTPGVHTYLLPATLKALQKSHAQTVLDLGCGNGACSAVLRSHGFAVSGCDLSASGIALARQAHPEIAFFQYDISTTFPQENAGLYDAVVSLEVVEHLLQPRQLVSAAYEALRPGGLLVLSTPYHGYWKNLALAVVDNFDKHWDPLRDFGHVKLFSRKTLRLLVSEVGFSVAQVIRVGRIPALACSMILVGFKPL